MSLATFTWKGVEVPCVPNMQERGNIVVFGGREVTVQFSLNVLLTNFLTVDSTLVSIDSELYTTDNQLPRPVSGMFLVFRGRTYRIISTAIDPTDVYSHVVLADKQSSQ